jgi:hypothetical protein
MELSIIRESSAPRQSCSSAIRPSISSDGDRAVLAAGVFFGKRLVVLEGFFVTGMMASKVRLQGYLDNEPSHNCRSHGTPSLFPSIWVPGRLRMNPVASARELICEQWDLTIAAIGCLRRQSYGLGDRVGWQRRQRPALLCFGEVAGAVGAQADCKRNLHGGAEPASSGRRPRTGRARRCGRMAHVGSTDF